MKNEKQILKKLDEIISLIKKKPLKLESHNFKINSNGWKKITVEGKKYLENPKKDIWEMLDRKYRGEQLFTYDAMMRETKKRGKRVPTDDELGELLEEDLENVVYSGARYADGNFYNLGSYLFLWSSTPSGSSNAWSRFLHTSYSTVNRYADSRGYGFSVRCLVDIIDMKKYIEEKYIIEDKEEIKLLRFLLDYCYHRATKHKTPVSGLVKGIDNLRKQLLI